MSGKSTRAKGRRGQSAAKALLTSRDWNCIDLSAGISSEDILAFDPDGNAWCIEVKNTVDILKQHRKQAIEQGKLRKKPWMLMSHIDGTNSWLIQRQSKNPVIWTGGSNE